MSKEFYIYIADNLEECCKELVEWDNTGILKPDGRVKFAQNMIRTSHDEFSLLMVTNCIRSEAVKKVATL